MKNTFAIKVTSEKVYSVKVPDSILTEGVDPEKSALDIVTDPTYFKDDCIELSSSLTLEIIKEGKLANKEEKVIPVGEVKQTP